MTHFLMKASLLYSILFISRFARLTRALWSLEPHVNGLFTPDLATPIFQLSDAKKNQWPLEVKDGLIGSCTNSSYEDISRVASLKKKR